MKETREKVSYTVSTYTANDGKTFDSKKKCEEYEETLECDRIFSLIPHENTDGRDWYYCSSQDHFLRWLTHMSENEYKYSDGFSTFPITNYPFSPGWYAIGDDYYDSRCERNYIYPIELESEIESYEESIAASKASIALLNNLKIK